MSKLKIPGNVAVSLLIASAFIFAPLIFPPPGRAHDGGHKSAPHEHKEFQGMKNPLAGNPKALEEGLGIYRTHCAKCHGGAGRGDGPAAKSLTPPPPDLTARVSIHGSSDGEIFHVIAHGSPKTAMPAFKKPLGEGGVWKVVEAVKSMRGKKK
jgi:hypothetical protein